MPRGKDGGRWHGDGTDDDPSSLSSPLGGSRPALPWRTWGGPLEEVHGPGSHEYEWFPPMNAFSAHFTYSTNSSLGWHGRDRGRRWGPRVNTTKTVETQRSSGGTPETSTNVYEREVDISKTESLGLYVESVDVRKGPLTLRVGTLVLTRCDAQFDGSGETMGIFWSLSRLVRNPTIYEGTEVSKWQGHVPCIISFQRLSRSTGPITLLRSGSLGCSNCKGSNEVGTNVFSYFFFSLKNPCDRETER